MGYDCRVPRRIAHYQRILLLYIDVDIGSRPDH